jgi:hypothetical protein
VIAVLVATALLVSVHLLAGHLRWMNAVPRSQWLSAAGGVSVAYVCLHLLPEVARAASPLTFWYLLVGMVGFYTLQRSVRARDSGTDTRTFWLSMSAFTLYNALIGYGLTRRDDLAWFTVAMALHFAVNDNSLRQDHGHTYHRVGRWLLAGAIATGAVAGVSIAVSPQVVELAFAVLSGGIVLNVFKEELPSERESRPIPFVAAAFGFGALLHFT